MSDVGPLGPLSHRPLSKKVIKSYPENYHGIEFCKSPQDAKWALEKYPRHFLHLLGHTIEGKWVLEIFGPQFTARW